VVDAVVEPDDLRSELVRRFAHTDGGRRARSPSGRAAKRNPVTPV
jgi:hypothetical protein